MKQYTNEQQTAKLIELGFEKPKSYHDIEWDGTEAYDYQLDYSIGELIAIIDGKVTLGIDKLGATWMASVLVFEFIEAELIDCLYEACVKLKEAGVI